MKIPKLVLLLVLILGISITNVCFAQFDFSSAGYQKYVEVAPPDGASIMVSSVPVVMQFQVSKNTFTANIPNDKGGYSTMILQKVGDRFIVLPVVVMGNGL